MKTGNACVSCHSGSKPGGGVSMTAAGTVYSSVTGGTAVAGATVTITGSDGTKVTMVTGSSGNFYTGSSISFPAKIQVSKCPDTASMTETITTGDCNSCHNATMRLHLP
jgi:hypothetical protein